ncbi:MAG: riboflavin synthase [Patescibacteria group bacterium]
MFTGIIETTGKIKKIDGHNYTIEVKNFLDDVKVGQSIAINGVCTTILNFNDGKFTVELMPETLRVTNFSEVKEGDEVNLEKSLKADGRLDGHFVLGHVDGVGKVEEIKEEGEFVDLIIGAPENLQKYLARKGAIAVNGVSLTIAEDLGDRFRVSLITHTREVTNFKNLQKGDAVNLEIDMLARYLEKLIKQ